MKFYNNAVQEKSTIFNRFGITSILYILNARIL